MFGNEDERSNAPFSGEKERSSAFFVDKGKRPNALSGRERKRGYDVKNGRAE